MSDKGDQQNNPPSPDIPDNIVGPERTLLQMFRLYIDPEIKRRQLSQSLPDQFTVVKAQVLFFERKSPQVRLNDEVKISLIVKAPRGNVDHQFVEMFNKLSRDREAARYDATGKGNLSSLINSDMIAKARAEIAKLKVRFKRFE